jgi:DNA-binding CsgD family transcriptional regulator
MVRGVLKNIRSPVTLIASGAGSKQWFHSVLLEQFLKQIGYVDCIVSMWAATDDRAMVLVCHRREIDPPFTESDVTLVSLMLRAAAPIVDRELFSTSSPIQLEELSQREREILLMLLSGDSEKEIAASLHRSVHTVHTFVSQLHKRFNVSSRGELMALFVDKAVIASIRQELPGE